MTISDVFVIIGNILGTIVPVLIALGIVYFVWGIVRYVIGDSEEAKKRGRDQMIFGVIGLAVVIGVWGLVYIITNTFSLEQSGPNPSDIQKLLPQPQ